MDPKTRAEAEYQLFTEAAILTGFAVRETDGFVRLHTTAIGEPELIQALGRLGVHATEARANACQGGVRVAVRFKGTRVRVLAIDIAVGLVLLAARLGSNQDATALASLLLTHALGKDLP